MQQLSGLEAEISRWKALDERANALLELDELATAADDASMLGEIEAEAIELQQMLAQMRLELLLSGPHDARDAIMTIHSGAGGTEAQDWTAMLERMYLRWAERHGLRGEIIDEAEGDEAGLKNATIEIRGRNAYGLLRSERGVHRLVRISPFDNAKRRHTTFALVEVIPDIGDEIAIDINPDDIKMDVYRASGHGGQNVQKNSTAIRLTHLPTGITVSCQNERSQMQNRERAMAVLRARLYDLELQKQNDEVASERRGQIGSGDRSERIRTYNFPKNRISDHRIGMTLYKLDQYLDGDLYELVDAMTMADQSQKLHAIEAN